MKMNFESLLPPLLIFISVYIGITAVFLMFRKYMSFRETELKVNLARMDDYRAHLEHQLIELNQKFSSSEIRWKELNHLVVSGQPEKTTTDKSRANIDPKGFLEIHGIDYSNIKIDNELIFVLTPFHESFRHEYSSIVAVGSELGLKVTRGDEKVNSGEIFPQILKSIVEARLIVAIISGRNPNVFYELGIAHALNKPVVLLASSDSNTEIPFDVKSKSILFYNDARELKFKLLKALAQIFINKP